MAAGVPPAHRWLDTAAAALARGTLDDAAQALDQADAALRRRAGDTLARAHARTLRGVLLVRLGRSDDAITCYRQALALHPGHADAAFNLAVALRGAGDHDGAARHFADALRAQPDFAEAALNLGQVLLERGDAAGARRHFTTAARLRPDWWMAQFNLAVAAQAEGDDDDALGAYGRAVALAPDHPAILGNYGNLLRLSGRLDDAEAVLERALALSPGNEDGLINLGVLRQVQGRLDEAVACYERALEIAPGSADALFNKGLALQLAGRGDQAACCYRAAMAADPAHGDARVNLGNVLREQGELDAASDVYAQAVAAAPVSAVAHHNLGQSLLQLGQFAEGWPEYEWRWHCPDFPSRPRRLDCARWQGEELAGLTILVWREQGVGDEILYASMIPDLVARGGRVILEASPRLVPVFARSFPQVTVVSRAETEAPGFLDAIDRHSPLASLGRWLRPDADAFPRHRGYLRADPAWRDRLRQRYHRTGRRLVGIAWHSRASGQPGAKSSRLDDWRPLLALPGHVFVDLQYGDTAAERAALERNHGLTVLHDDGIDQLADLDALFAQVAAMDLVVTTSNTTAHVAGALGVPALVLVPAGAGLFWYWFTGRDDSPFYPSVRLLRQSAPGRWDDVLERAAALVQART